jgi:hypothetical protein
VGEYMRFFIQFCTYSFNFVHIHPNFSTSINFVRFLGDFYGNLHMENMKSPRNNSFSLL